jgi:hypothetical protein
VLVTKYPGGEHLSVGAIHSWRNRLDHSAGVGKWDSIPALLGVNSALCSILAFAVILLRFRNAQAARLKQIAIWLVFPVSAMSCLACFPSLNPLWPVGMAELSRQELELKKALPLNMGLDDARGVLRAKGVEFQESTERVEGVIFDGPDGKIKAVPGDRVLSSRFRTSATDFVCGYDMNIILLFGQDERLKERYIHRFPICL